MNPAEIRITAEPIDSGRCKFMVSEPVHGGGVRRFASAEEASGSPLAEGIFAIADADVADVRVHLVAAAETAIWAQSYPDASRFQSSARNHAQTAVAADRNMVRRMGHDLALRLLLVDLFDQLDRFLEIEQRSKLIATQYQGHL